MKPLRHPYSRGLVGIPTVLLAVAWFALWLLWPQVRIPLQTPRARGEQPRVFYVDLASKNAIVYKSPIVFARSSAIGFVLASDEEQPSETFVPGPKNVKPEFLQLPLLQPAQDVQATDPRVREDLPAISYQPIWSTAPAAPQDSQAALKLLVEPSPSLKECGFRVSEVLAETLVQFGRPFIARADVDVLDGGSVGDVFLLATTGDAAIDRAVIGLLGQANALNHGPACSGRVVISLGR